MPRKRTERVGLPRWLELHEEIDYWSFILNSMYREALARSSIDRFIDQSTGYERKLVRDAKKIMKKLDELKEEYYSIIDKK